LTVVRYLDLSRNKIGNFDPAWNFKVFENLRELDISSNDVD